MDIYVSDKPKIYLFFADPSSSGSDSSMALRLTVTGDWGVGLFERGVTIKIKEAIFFFTFAV